MMEYYLVLKRNEILTRGITQVHQEDTMLNEIIQSQKRQISPLLRPLQCWDRASKSPKLPQPFRNCVFVIQHLPGCCKPATVF